MAELNRRTALSLLGVAGVSAPITAEAVSRSLDTLPGAGPNSIGYRFGIGQVSTALRRLADDIDSGGTCVQSIDLSAACKIEEFLQHKLTIEFALNEIHDPAA